MTIVRHQHMRALGYCNRGSREWFARHGLSWADFVREGIDAEQLRATNDAMADRVIARAEQEGSQHDGQQ